MKRNSRNAKALMMVLAAAVCVAAFAVPAMASAAEDDGSDMVRSIGKICGICGSCTHNGPECPKKQTAVQAVVDEGALAQMATNVALGKLDPILVEQAPAASGSGEHIERLGPHIIEPKTGSGSEGTDDGPRFGKPGTPPTIVYPGSNSNPTPGPKVTSSKPRTTGSSGSHTHPTGTSTRTHTHRHRLPFTGGNAAAFVIAGLSLATLGGTALAAPARRRRPQA